MSAVLDDADDLEPGRFAERVLVAPHSEMAYDRLTRDVLVIGRRRDPGTRMLSKAKSTQRAGFNVQRYLDLDAAHGPGYDRIAYSMPVKPETRRPNRSAN